LLAAALLAGCASQEARNDAELQEMLQWLPGHYDNQAQSQSDTSKGVRPPHESLTVDIVQIDSPMIGDHVFYMQESAADDPRRVTSQRVLMFAVVNKDIVQTSLTLSTPLRWRNGQRNPDLFKSLMPADVHSVKGCSVRWKKTAERFTGANEPKTCHGSAHGAGGLAKIDYRAELGPEDFATAELAFDSEGRLVRGREDEPFYRFHKQARDPQEGESTD